MLVFGSIAEWFLLVVTAVAVMLGYSQLRTSRKATKDQMRAYLVVRLDIDNTGQDRTKVILSIKNFGLSPARNCKLSFQEENWHGLKSAKHFPFLRAQGIEVIPPGAESRYFVGYVDGSERLKRLVHESVEGYVEYRFDNLSEPTCETVILTLGDFAGAVRIRQKRSGGAKT